MRRKQQGFTIIELLIATVVFSVVLLVITGAIVQFGRIYYKGVVSSKTQETARVIAEDVAQNIQFAAGEVPSSDENSGVFCAGGRRYSFIIDSKLTDTQHVIVADSVDSCFDEIEPIDLADIPDDATELIGTKMRLSKFSVVQDDSNDRLYKITVKVIYGDDDLVEDTNGDDIGDRCKTGIGSQFCVAAELITTANRRRN